MRGESVVTGTSHRGTVVVVVVRNGHGDCLQSTILVVAVVRVVLKSTSSKRHLVDSTTVAPVAVETSASLAILVFFPHKALLLSHPQ